MVAFNTSVSGTTTGAAIAYTSVNRWNYISISNTGGGTPGTIYARTDGVAAVSGADGTYSIPTGQTLTFSNDLGYWNQAYSVIPAGSYATDPTGSPKTILPYGSSLAGGTANPGTSVSVIGVTGATYEISAAG